MGGAKALHFVRQVVAYTTPPALRGPVLAVITPVVLARPTASVGMSSQIITGEKAAVT